MAHPHLKPAPGLLTRGSPPTALIDLILASVPSPNTRRAYSKGIAELYRFSASERAAGWQPITLPLLLRWRAEMAERLAAATVNLRISAVRKLVREARRAGLLPQGEAWDLLQIENLPTRGTRIGHWLTAEQTRRILQVPARTGLRGKRNYCILAMLAGCALRVSDLADLDVESLTRRDGRPVIADLLGKGGRVRTVAIPAWVQAAIEDWTKASGIRAGRLIRPLSGIGPYRAPGTTLVGLSTQGIWDIVRKAGSEIGVENFGPHDLRRTCARLCRDRGGDIEQIQMMLGHASLVTTQRYLGSTQNLKQAVNDDLGL